MKSFFISRKSFSNFFWDQLPYGKSIPYSIEPELEELRKSADYNTGSLSMQDVLDLGALVSYFKPTSVCEVGTFIGRSTHTIAANMERGTIWTCDASNALDLPAPQNSAVTIRQFPKWTSNGMLDKAALEHQTFDMFYIDGRINERDAELMISCERLSGSIFVLDDFEGFEKGVANASLLMNALISQGWDQLLIYPRASGKTAVILPQNQLKFVNQV